MLTGDGDPSLDPPLSLSNTRKLPLLDGRRDGGFAIGLASPPTAGVVMVSNIGGGGGCGSLLLSGVSGDLLAGVCGTKGVLSLFGVSIPGK